MTTHDSDELPYATAKSLKVLGKIRQGPEDFEVDEVPAYAPTGHGDHLFIRFRKIDRNTADAVGEIARALGVDPRAAGFAGLKDRRAVTTQWASFFGADKTRALSLELPGIQILEAERHPHKLRTGHLKGNHFRILVRELSPGAEATATQVLGDLAKTGAPGFYGEQRFGVGGSNRPRAERLMLDGQLPRSRFERKLLVSVWQARWFNTWLAERMRAGLFATAIAGDVMRREDSGGLFVADDRDEAQARMDRFEISPTGPIFGADMRWPTLDALAIEHELLARSGVNEARLRELRKLAPGARRVARVRPENVRVVPDPHGLLLVFSLPAGAYATVILRELLKTSEDARDPSPPAHDANGQDDR